MSMKRLLFIVLLSFFSVTERLWATYSPHCRLIVQRAIRGLDPNRGTRSLDQISELKIGTYNLRNLYHTVGEYKYVDGVYQRVHHPRQKDPDMIREQAEVIDRMDLDILVVQEVEELSSIMHFVQSELKTPYDVFWLGGNDPRGLQVAYLIKKDLPIEVSLYTHMDEPMDRSLRSTQNSNSTWWEHSQTHAHNSIERGQNDSVPKLHTRDLGLLEIRELGATSDSPALLALYAVHYKSLRDRPDTTTTEKIKIPRVPKGKDARKLRRQQMLKIKQEAEAPLIDKGSKKLRREQVLRTAMNIAEYRDHYGYESPIVLLGDFNAPFNFTAEMRPLWSRANLEEAANIIDESPSRFPNRVTHSYFSDDSPPHHQQLDGIFLSRSLQPLLGQYQVEPYRDANGEPMPLPRNYAERELLPSDHRPVWISLDMPSLLRLQQQRVQDLQKQ